MFQWLLGKREAKSAGSSSLDVLRAYLLGQNTAAGVNVNAERALGVATVLRCATLLGNGCSQIPFKLYQSLDEGKKRAVVTDHPVAKLMTRRPNSWQTPSEWRRTMTMHAAISDFGLSIITRGVRGDPLELIPVRPDWISWKQDSDFSLTYTVAWPSGEREDYEQDDVFVLRGPSWDSVKGLGALRYAREAIGLRMAVDQSQAKLFANGVRPGGILTSKTPMDEEQRELAKANWREMHGGSENVGKTALLEGDLSWVPLALNNVDAETMKLRGQQTEEICAAFGIFPQMVGHNGESSPTFASAEQFFIQHVVHSLQPWHVAWEDAMSAQLLTDDEAAEGLYFKFTVQALLRGTAVERGNFYKLLVDMGAVKPNEVRSWEELDFAPELEHFRIPLAMTIVKPDGTPLFPPKPGTTGAPGDPTPPADPAKP